MDPTRAPKSTAATSTPCSISPSGGRAADDEGAGGSGAVSVAMATTDATVSGWKVGGASVRLQITSAAAAATAAAASAKMPRRLSFAGRAAARADLDEAGKGTTTPGFASASTATWAI